MRNIKEFIRDKLLVANFISNLFYSTAFPVIHFVLIKDAGQKMISLSSIVMCSAGVIFPFIWNKYSKEFYKKYGILLALEIMGYTILCILILSGNINNKVYYIIDTLLFALITKNIICGGNKLRSIRYNTEDKRERYDNNSNIVANLSSLIGFCISFIITLPVNIAFVLITVGICFDNIFYYEAYKESLDIKWLN